MYLKNDKIVATIGNIVMRSSRVGSTQEFVLDPTAVVGWTDGPNARRDATVRLNSDGDFSEKATMSSRVISFSGTAVAASIVDLQTMRDNFVGLLADGSYQTLTVETKTGVRSATVGLENSTSWIQQSDTFASFHITLYAPDPYLYSEPRTINIGSSSTVGGGLDFILKYPLNFNSSTSQVVSQTLTTSGNVDAWPRFIVTGDYFSGFTLQDNQDHKVTYTGVVSMQAPVEIDMAKGIALQNGIDRSTYITDRQWFSVSPGEVVRPTFTPIQTGVGWCDIIIRDTWI